jgi:hypothetical protein
VLDELRQRLETWMGETEDPLLHGPVEPQRGTALNRPDQSSPDDPTYVVDAALTRSSGTAG